MCTDAERMCRSNVQIECADRMCRSNVQNECADRMCRSNVQIECADRMCRSNVQIECADRMCRSNVHWCRTGVQQDVRAERRCNRPMCGTNVLSNVAERITIFADRFLTLIPRHRPRSTNLTTFICV